MTFEGSASYSEPNQHWSEAWYIRAGRGKYQSREHFLDYLPLRRLDPIP